MTDLLDTTIGALCTAGHVQLQTGPFGSQLHSYDYVADGVPVVPTEGIRARRIDLSVCPRISNEKALELQRHRLQSEDILFARRGVQATGHIGVVRKSEEGFICGTGAIRLRVVPENPLVDADYLSHVLADPKSIAWFKFHAIGATMPNLNEGIIRSFPLRLPAVSYQREVAKLFSSLDDKIELNRRMNETLKAMAHAIFRDWFVDFGPVRRKLAGAIDPVEVMGGVTTDAPRAAELASLFPGRLDAEGVPEGWLAEPLSRQIEIIGGGTPKTSVAEYWGGAIPWFSVVDTPSGSDVFVFNTEKTISAGGLANSSARLVSEGTTIISARGTVGNLAIAGQEMAFNQSCYALRSARGEHPCFVYLTAAHAVEQLRSMAHGSVFSTITRQTFDALAYVSPSPELLAEIESVLAPLFGRLKVSVDENRMLSKTRDYLLPRLMSGEVRVDDVAQEIAA